MEAIAVNIQGRGGVRCTGFHRVGKKGNKEQVLAFIPINTSKQIPFFPAFLGLFLSHTLGN